MAFSGKRRRHLINPAFQWRFIGFVFAAVFLTLAMSAALTTTLINLHLRTTLEPQAEIVTVLALSLAILFTASVALFFLALRYSHRVAGPLHRIRSVLQDVIDGAIPEACRIRKGDAHAELAETVTEALRALRERRETELRAWQEIADQIRALANGSDFETSEVQESIRRIAESCASASEV